MMMMKELHRRTFVFDGEVRQRVVVVSRRRQVPEGHLESVRLGRVDKATARSVIGADDEVLGGRVLADDGVLATVALCRQGVLAVATRLSRATGR